MLGLVLEFAVMIGCDLCYPFDHLRCRWYMISFFSSLRSTTLEFLLPDRGGTRFDSLRVRASNALLLPEGTLVVTRFRLLFVCRVFFVPSSK